MGGMAITQKRAGDGGDPYTTRDSVTRSSHENRVNASGLVLDPALRDAGVAALPDPPATLLSPAAFTNPALAAEAGRPPTAAPAPKRDADPCADALPTQLVVAPHPRGAFEPPNHVELSCTKEGGLCLSKEEGERLQALRRRVCASTGLDPLRFEKIAPPGPEVDRDRAWERDQRDAASLRNLELMAQNPFAAAAYGPARIAGVPDETAQKVAQVAAAASDVAFVAMAARGLRASTSAEKTSAATRPVEKEPPVLVAPRPAPSGDGGSIRNVNRGLPVGRTPGTRDMNCANCAVATDAMLGGSPATALPGEVTDADALSAFYGRPWIPMRGIAHLQIEMQRAGPRSRGIVLGERDFDVGHFFNVVNQGNTVRFLDGQTGEPAKLADGYARFWLLRTN